MSILLYFQQFGITLYFFHLIIGRFIRQILALKYNTIIFQKNVNISIEYLFLDIVDPVNQLTVLTIYLTALTRGIQFVNTGS